MGRQLFGGDRLIDRHGVDRQAALREIGGKIAGAVLAREIENPRGAIEPSGDQIDQIAERALSRHGVGETGRPRGFRGSRADREAAQLRQFTTTRVRGERPRGIRAGHQHAIVGTGKFRRDREHREQRRDQHLVSTRAQCFGGARCIGFGPRDEQAHGAGA